MVLSSSDVHQKEKEKKKSIDKKMQKKREIECVER